jgi:PAS domain S-box-containing protein
MPESSFIGIIHNAALLLAIVIVFTSTALRWRSERVFWRQCVIGIILGLIAVAVMLSPWEYSKGLFFDTRSILLCITGLYFGFIPTFIAMLMTIALRYTQGGVGVWMGIGVIISSCIIGLTWRHFRKKNLEKLSWFELYLFGILVHIFMLIMVIFLPHERIVSTLLNIYIPVLIIYPLGTSILGTMLSKRLYDETLSDQIKESEVKYKIVANNTYDWEYWIDNDGKFIYCSLSCLRITGHSADEFFKSPSLLTDIIHHEDKEIYLNHNIDDAIGKQLDYRIILPDGSIRWVGQVHTTVWENNKCLGLRASIRDITERKMMELERGKLERQMQQTQKLESLGVLAGGIAHDFNNILMAILGHAELTQYTLSPMSPARENINQIITASHRAAELCQQMLAYSGKASLSNMHINLGELVNEMVHLLKTSISKKALLNLHIEKDTPMIEGDPSQIRQVVMNLIINASDAIGELSGVISVSVGATRCDDYYLKTTELFDNLSPGLYTHIEVSDTGCGMDAETQARIFEPFFTTKFLGRGLGLAAVVGIVRTHNGAIKVYSEQGKGTTFKLLFPSLPSNYSNNEDTNGATANTKWTGQGTILLADDEESIRAVAASMLELIGYKVLTAVDGREAIDIYNEKKNEIDIVVLDMTMPHVDGGEAFKEIRRINPDAKVLIASGYSKEDIGARFAGKGVTEVLQKPYTMKSLRESLKNIDVK